MKKVRQPLSVGFLYDDTLDSDAGVAQYVKTLGAWLSSRGHKVSYLVGQTRLKSWAGGRVYSLAKNQTVIFNGNRLSMPLPAKRHKIKQLFANKNFDVIHVQMPYSPFLAKRVIDAAPRSTAIVGTFHIYPASVLSELGNRLLKLVLGNSLSKFNAIVAVSQPASAFANRYYKINSRVIPNMVDLRKFKAASPNEHKGQRIIFLGRLVERKGAKYMLEAFRLLARQMPDVSLLIIGDGPQMNSLQRYVRKHNLSERVRFTGYIDEPDKPKMLSAADIACFPSLHGESFGIVLVEAMAAGAKVVLGGDNPGYASVLGRSSGTLFNPRDTKELALILKKYLTNEELINSVCTRQQALVKRFDVDTVGPKIEDLYVAAIASKSQSGHN